MKSVCNIVSVTMKTMFNQSFVRKGKEQHVFHNNCFSLLFAQDIFYAHILFSILLLLLLFFIKKFSVVQKHILHQQNKLFHKGNRTIVPRIIALQFTTDNYTQVITSGKLPPDNGSQVNGFHVIVPR